MSIIIYSTPTCGHCRHAKEFFKEKGLAYEEIDVARDRVKAQEMIDKTGQLSVPVIEINGKILIGFNPLEIEVALN